MHFKIQCTGSKKGLMSNIRNGLKLRKKGNDNEAPKRLKDDFEGDEPEPSEPPESEPAPAPAGAPGYGDPQPNPYPQQNSNNDDKMMELLKMMALMQGMQNMPSNPDLVDKAAAIIKPDYKPPQQRQPAKKKAPFKPAEDPTANMLAELKVRRKQILGY